MNHRYAIVITLLLAIISAAFSAMVSAQTCKELVITAHANNAPISFGENESLQGIGFELFEHLTQALNIPIQRTSPFPWKRAIKHTADGEIDILIGIRKTPDRIKQLDFIEPPFTRTAHTIFILETKKNDIKSKQDLPRYRGGITLGSVVNDSLGHEFAPLLKLNEVNTMEQNFRKLLIGRIDYFIAPLLPTIHSIQHSFPGQLDQLAFISTPLSVTEEYIAISKKSPCNGVKDMLSHSLQQVKSDGTFDQWLGQSMAHWGALDWYIQHQD